MADSPQARGPRPEARGPSAGPRPEALLLALAACSHHARPQAPTPPPPPATPLAGGATAADAAHLLARLTFGPRPGEAAQLARTGLAAWLDAQLRPDQLADPAGDAALAPYAGALATPADLQAAAERLRADPDPVDGKTGKTARQQMRREILLDTQMLALARYVASERQLLEVMVDFWTNHFAVSLQKGPVRFFAADFVEHALRPHALGRFEDLLVATARHPAMLHYLDNAQSVAPPPGSLAARRGRGINENYARELMELHTVGLAAGYTQADVIAVARILSGWSVAGEDFVFRAHMHDEGAKVVMGQVFPAGGGEDEGLRLLHFLAAHPATAEHVCRQLCSRLVADDPPAASVAAATAAWRASGGELAAVVRAIVADPSFWRPEVRGAKMKSPLEVAVSAVRAVGGALDGDGLAKVMVRLGEPLLLAPAPTGYADTEEAWLSTAGALERMDLALALAAARLPGVHVALDRVLPPPAAAEPLPAWRAATLARLDAMVAGGLGASRPVVARWLARPRQARRARTVALALTLASPEFQKR